MTNKVKTTRNLKVIEQSGYRYQATPTVMLKGKWLSEFGFEIGTQVKVECENGKLIITKEEAIADAVELLKEESPNAPGNIAGVQLIPIEKVRAFKDHPFRLYKEFEQDKFITRKLSFTGKSLTDIINMTYRCRVVFAMI